MVGLPFGVRADHNLALHSGHREGYGFLASRCTHRSLNPLQRALIAAGFLEREREQAKQRQAAAGGSKPGALREMFPEAGEARDKAGERMHVSWRTAPLFGPVRQSSANAILAAR